MAEIPKLDVALTKQDKLARDLAKLELAAPVKKAGENAPPVPTFQRQGYLEKLGHTRRKWFKRFFVLRDSFLLSYNLQKSDFTVEPRASIHLGNSKIQVLAHGDKPHCFFVTTTEKDQFLFSCESEEERSAWIRDIEVARTITHANMVKLSVENQCLAEEKGVGNVVSEQSASALTIFSNSEYIKNTPLTGGAEGWLRTLGFNPEPGKSQSVKKSDLKKCYFMLRDSHLLMFHGGDILTKPRGVMYLVGTITEEGVVEDGMHRFVCRSQECGDNIELFASSEKQRKRWIQALRIGARVTYPDFKLLLKEHEVLASVMMTPRAAPPSQPNQPAVEDKQAPPVPLFAENVDIQGKELDPATQQPYDQKGNPLFRNPEGKLVNSEGNMQDAKTPRFNATGQQLDPFNRPLPPGAVPMFTSNGMPIGVGPDGKHYLPDGTIIPDTDPHFDAEGKQLPTSVVAAANGVASDVNVAIKIRARMKGEGNAPEAVDALGRTFRGDPKAGKLLNADGEEMPLQSARGVNANTGQLEEYKAPEVDSNATQSLAIKVDDEGDEKDIGEVQIHSGLTLRDVRGLINEEVKTDFPDFVFLVNGIPMMKYEEGDRLATSCLPEVVIRGKELKKFEAPKAKFNKKVEEMLINQEEKKKERSEFDEIMAKVRQGQFLKSVKPQA